MIIDSAKLRDVAEIEFSDIVEDVIIPDLNELRIVLKDGSFVDVWHSLKLEGRFSLHWERQFLDGTIYRHDNAPHLKWSNISSFPTHFHNGTEDSVEASSISSEPETALREFLTFVKQRISG